MKNKQLIVILVVLILISINFIIFVSVDDFYFKLLESPPKYIESNSVVKYWSNYANTGFYYFVLTINYLCFCVIVPCTYFSLLFLFPKTKAMKLTWDIIFGVCFALLLFIMISYTEENLIFIKQTKYIVSLLDNNEAIYIKENKELHNYLQSHYEIWSKAYPTSKEFITSGLHRCFLFVFLCFLKLKILKSQWGSPKTVRKSIVQVKVQ